MTLHHWQRLATPHMGGLLDARPGIKSKGSNRSDPQDTSSSSPGMLYSITDFEEDGMLKLGEPHIDLGASKCLEESRVDVVQPCGGVYDCSSSQWKDPPSAVTANDIAVSLASKLRANVSDMNASNTSIDTLVMSNSELADSQQCKRPLDSGLGCDEFSDLDINESREPVIKTSSPKRKVPTSQRDIINRFEVDLQDIEQSRYDSIINTSDSVDLPSMDSSLSEPMNPLYTLSTVNCSCNDMSNGSSNRPNVEEVMSMYSSNVALAGITDKHTENSNKDSKQYSKQDSKQNSKQVSKHSCVIS